jgi:hypothetical protein
MASEDEITPPPRQLSSLAGIVTRVETLIERVDSVVAHQQRTTLPAAGDRPSLAVKAARGTTRVGKVLMICAGVLSVAGQVVAIWKPAYAGPIVEALRLLASLGGG